MTTKDAQYVSQIPSSSKQASYPAKESRAAVWRGCATLCGVHAPRRSRSTVSSPIFSSCSFSRSGGVSALHRQPRPGPCGSCGRTGLRLLSHRKVGRHRWPARRLRVASPLRQCRLCSGIGPSRACTSTRSSAPALSAGSSRRSNRCERSTKRHRSMVTKTWRQPALQALGSRHKSRIRRAATFSPRLRPAITAGIANGPRSTPAVFEYVAVLRLPE